MIDKFAWLCIGIGFGMIIANSIISHHQKFRTFFTGQTFICAEIVDDNS